MGRKWTLVKTTILAAMVVFGTVIGCSDDDSPAGPGDGPGGGGGVTMPASWGGTWVVSEGALPPARQEGFEVTVDAFCAGITAEDLILDGDEGTCTGTWTDTNASLVCTGSETFGDCTETFTARVELTRNGDAFTGTINQSITYSEECGEDDEEGGFSVSATRVNDDQIGCDDLQEGLPSSWGGTWNVTTTGGNGNRGEGDLLCPGDMVEEIIFSDAPGDVDVIGGFTETRLEAFATLEETNGTECTTIQTTTIEITRDGNSLTGTGVERTYTLQTPGQATCAETGVEVENFTLTGTRTSTDVSACSGGTVEGGLPEELAGIWNIEYLIVDEDTQQIVDQGTENGVVLQAGDPIDEIFFEDFIPPGGTRTCTPSTFNGGVFNGSCTHEYSFEGCSVTIPMDVTGQLAGNVFTFSGGVGFVASPPECVPEIELNLTGTATRVGFRRGSLSFLHR